VTPVAGGCINHGARLDLTGGAPLFLKWNGRAPSGLFEREAEGLVALRAPRSLRVPEPLAWGAGDPVAWLLMEHVAEGAPRPGSERLLAEGLGRIHAVDPGFGFGWDRDNWIGTLPQPNEPCESWGAFWRDRRLTPQLERARERGFLARGADAALVDRVLDVTEGGLADVTTPELVHGDLWSGNVYTDPEGKPVLIDPAVHAGHGEVDLAMSELFGGFGPGFYLAYDETRGITAAYRAYRRALYQLYFLLVHVNLFGGSYVAGALGAARDVVAELG